MSRSVNTSFPPLAKLIDGLAAEGTRRSFEQWQKALQNQKADPEATKQVDRDIKRCKSLIKVANMAKKLQLPDILQCATLDALAQARDRYAPQYPTLARAIDRAVE